MERDPSIDLRRPSYFSGCMSPAACLPAAQREFGYGRIQDECPKRGRHWRNLLRRLVAKSNLYGSKPLSFQYDAVSYSQNFDDGFHGDEQFSGRRRHWPPTGDCRLDSSTE